VQHSQCQTRGRHGDARRQSALDVVRLESYTYAGLLYTAVPAPGRKPRAVHHGSFPCIHPSIHPQPNHAEAHARRTYATTSSLAYKTWCVHKPAGDPHVRDCAPRAPFPAAPPRSVAMADVPFSLAAIARSGLVSIAVACGLCGACERGCRRAGALLRMESCSPLAITTVRQGKGRTALLSPIPA
jgi:hypothetical protein